LSEAGGKESDEGAGTMDEEGAGASPISLTVMNPLTPVNIDRHVIFVIESKDVNN
jgi:hypothetical protein